MSATPVDLYVAAYSDPAAADRDWAVLVQLEEDERIELDALVLVSRDQTGEIQIPANAHDLSRGSLIGAVGGLIVGIVFPPSLLASALVGLGLGAGFDRLVSHYGKNQIKVDVDEVLPPGSSGIVVLFEERWGDRVDRAFQNADLIRREKVDRQSAERLKTAASAYQLAAVS